jgi:hypothetical protein
MPSYLTRRDLQYAHSAVSRALRDPDKKTMTESVVGVGLSALEVNAGAFAGGVMGGRWGSVDLYGVPADAASGLALHALGLTGLAGKYGEHVHNFANGLLAAWTMRAGVTVGMLWRQKAGLSAVAMQLPGTATAGVGANVRSIRGARGALTPEELRAMAQAMPSRRAA